MLPHPPPVPAQVTFRCKVPQVEDSVQLEGMTSYEAATHCAALMAAQRQAAEAAAMQQLQQAAQEQQRSLHALEERRASQLHPAQHSQQVHQAHGCGLPRLSFSHASPLAPIQPLAEQCPTPFSPHEHPSATPLQASHQQHALSTPWSQHPVLPDGGYVEATATPAGTGLQCGFDAAASSTPVPFGQLGLRRSARLRAAQALLGR